MNITRFSVYGLLCFYALIPQDARGVQPDSGLQCEFGAYVIMGSIEVLLPQYIVIDTAAAHDSAGNAFQVIAVTSDTMYYGAAATHSFDNVRMNLISIRRDEGNLVLPRNVVVIENFDPSWEGFQESIKVTVREFLQPDQYFEFFQQSFRAHMRVADGNGR